GALAARLAPARPAPAPEAFIGRIAVLIPAHNEEAVLGGTLSALARSRFPTRAYDVFVVADNCLDATAMVARRHGAYVLERRSNGQSTKGQALKALWEQVQRPEHAAVVVLDADNHVEAGFLGAIAAELGRGYPAVQGLRRAKNEDNGTAGLDALTELCTHRIGAAGRRALGLNGPLMGSGVGYAAALFDRYIRDVGDALNEDCDWQARMALEGLTIAWTPRAVIFDEKTGSAQALQTQRNRWMAGRAQVARAHLRQLLLKGLTGNRNALDMAAFLLSIPRVLMLAGWGSFCLLGLAHAPGFWPASVWFACLALFALYVLLGLALDGAPRSAYLGLGRGVLQLPRFAWQMAHATGKALVGARVRWIPTPHSH
ncbi:MAG TPA: glycosyltransferase family 2 protein, partial [Oscillatoriaceae cyanobacterium]